MLIGDLVAVSVEVGSQTAKLCRTLYTIADVLALMAVGRGGLRSGPAANAQWQRAIDSIEAREKIAQFFTILYFPADARRGKKCKKCAMQE